MLLEVQSNTAELLHWYKLRMKSAEKPEQSESSLFFGPIVLNPQLLTQYFKLNAFFLFIIYIHPSISFTQEGRCIFTELLKSNKLV